MNSDMKIGDAILGLPPLIAQRLGPFGLFFCLLLFFLITRWALAPSEPQVGKEGNVSHGDCNRISYTEFEIYLFILILCAWLLYHFAVVVRNSL